MNKLRSTGGCKISAQSSSIYIGKKPLLNYVLAAMINFNSGIDTVVLKARGNMISKAVDVARMVIERMLNTVKIEDVKIDSEFIEQEGGSKRRVSTIEITLKHELT